MTRPIRSERLNADIRQVENGYVVYDSPYSMDSVSVTYVAEDIPALLLLIEKLAKGFSEKVEEK